MIASINEHEPKVQISYLNFPYSSYYNPLIWFHNVSTINIMYRVIITQHAEHEMNTCKVSFQQWQGTFNVVALYNM